MRVSVWCVCVRARECAWYVRAHVRGVCVFLFSNLELCLGGGLLVLLFFKIFNCQGNFNVWNVHMGSQEFYHPCLRSLDVHSTTPISGEHIFTIFFKFHFTCNSISQFISFVNFMSCLWKSRISTENLPGLLASEAAADKSVLIKEHNVALINCTPIVQHCEKSIQLKKIDMLSPRWQSSLKTKINKRLFYFKTRINAFICDRLF